MHKLDCGRLDCIWKTLDHSQGKSGHFLKKLDDILDFCRQIGNMWRTKSTLYRIGDKSPEYRPSFSENVQSFLVNGPGFSKYSPSVHSPAYTAAQLY